jgi:hypothetical protein
VLLQSLPLLGISFAFGLSVTDIEPQQEAKSEDAYSEDDLIHDASSFHT